MSRSKIIGIVVLMATSLLGLVLLQVYWVGSALRLKGQEFDKNVFDALYEVVYEHKKNETAEFVHTFITTSDADGQGVIVINEDTFTLPQMEMDGPDFEVWADDIEGVIDDPNFALVRRHLHWEDNEPVGYVPRAFRSAQRHLQEAGASEWYATLLRNIVGELPMIAVPIDQSIDMESLQALLDRKLEKRGIDLDFAFAVERVGADEVLCQTNQCTEVEVLSSNYRANMYPDRLLSQPTFLYIHFPKKIGFLLRSMWMRLGTSVLLILLITGCFAFVVWTIFRQKRLSEMKSDFINNMTHEFKTPLATLSLAGQAINDPAVMKSPDRLTRFGQAILEESGKLTGHVERILQMAMIDKNELRMVKQPVDMHEIVLQAAETHRMNLKEADTLVTNLEATNSILKGDAMHLANLVGNLVDNAVKYSKEGHVEVTLNTANSNGTFILRVDDNGIGMNKETQRKIFERFYRTSTGNVHNVKGFGLGLNYVKYIVDAHNGTIKVRSEEGQGSSFEVHLPTA